MQSQPTPEPIRNYTAALIQSAAQLSTIIEQMARFSREHPNPRSKPIVVVLTELVEGILEDNLGRFDREDLVKAAQVLVAATEAVGSDLFFVDPKLAEEHGLPDLN